jgi:hypothetical protein
MRNELTTELIDYFEGRNRFEARNDYLGMEASRIPELFVEYFESLRPELTKEFAAVIVAGARGQTAELQPYLRQVAQLLGDLCMHRQCQYFADEAVNLEREFNDPQNLRHWVEDGEEESPEGVDFKRAWRYALILWGVLYMLESTRIQTNYEYLLGNAASEHFRRALSSVRRMYDSADFKER